MNEHERDRSARAVRRDVGIFMRWRPLRGRSGPKVDGSKVALGQDGPKTDPTTIDPSQRPGLPPSDRCLFIVGAARSGTTILQNALNDAPDIFLFGEPNFHDDAGAPGFAARYNAMHRSWANQETKSTFCPAVLPTDGAWADYLLRLKAHYRYVGSKIVINPVRDGGYLGRFFDFHCRDFYRSRYLFTFRRPLPTVASTRGLQVLVRGESDDLRTILRNYAEVAGLYIRMARNLPHVRAVFHEDVGRPTFDALERWLEVPLEGSHRYYEASKVNRYEGLDGTLGYPEIFAALEGIYDGLRQEAGAEFRALQAEQNDNHLSAAHFTAIGKIQRQIDAVIRDLTVGG